MAWFGVCLIGVLKILGVLTIPVHWVIVACGVALLFDISQRSGLTAN